MFESFNKPKVSLENVRRFTAATLAVLSMGIMKPDFAHAEVPKGPEAQLISPKYDPSLIVPVLAMRSPREFTKLTFTYKNLQRSSLTYSPNGNNVIQMGSLENINNLININGIATSVINKALPTDYQGPMKSLNFDINISNGITPLSQDDILPVELWKGALKGNLGATDLSDQRKLASLEIKDGVLDGNIKPGLTVVVSGKITPLLKKIIKAHVIVKDFNNIKNLSFADSNVEIFGKTHLNKHPEILNTLLEHSENTNIIFRGSEFIDSHGDESYCDEGFTPNYFSDQILGNQVNKFSDFVEKAGLTNNIRLVSSRLSNTINGENPDQNSVYKGVGDDNPFSQLFVGSQKPKGVKNTKKVKAEDAPKTVEAKATKNVNADYDPNAAISTNKVADYNSDGEAAPAPRVEQVVQSDFIVENKNEDTNHAQLIEMKATLWKGLLQQGPRNIEIKLNIPSSALYGLGADGFGYEMSINGAPAQQVFKTSQTTNNIYTIVLPKVQRGDRIVLTQMMFKGDVHIQVPNPTVNQFTVE